MKSFRYTDLDRYRVPYAIAKASEEPGYLANKFALIREQQARDEAERAEKLRPMKKALGK